MLEGKISPAELQLMARKSLRHYVPITLYGRSPEVFKANAGMAKAAAISAFVVAARGHWFLLTAGHVFDRMAVERGKGVTFLDFRLFDGWSPNAIDKNYVPFDFDGVGH